MSQLQHQDDVSHIIDIVTSTTTVLAPYLSALKNFKSRRLISRFRCGCHGLHVDTGEFKPVGQKEDRKQRFCLVFASDTAEDEHHFVFDCPAYCSIRDKVTAVFLGTYPGFVL